VAAVLAVAYMVTAAMLVRADRVESTGGWISLQGLVSAIVTMPVSFPLEYLDHKLDYRNNWQMGAAILVCGAIVFALAYGAMSLFELVLVSKPARPRES